MLKLSPCGYYKFFQDDFLQGIFSGGEANVAVFLANFGIDSTYITKLTEHAIGQAVVTKTKDLSIGELNTLLNNLLSLVQTNLTRLEITELLLSAPKYRGVEIRQMTVPISGSYSGMRGLGGCSLFSVDFDTNAKELRKFIYGAIK